MCLLTESFICWQFKFVTCMHFKQSVGWAPYTWRHASTRLPALPWASSSMTYSQESMLLTTYTNISHQQSLCQIICFREMSKKGQNRREARWATDDTICLSSPRGGARKTAGSIVLRQWAALCCLTKIWNDNQLAGYKLVHLQWDPGTPSVNL